ncbi:hypothetical protein [Streptomyces sp. NPDC058678]|uniref:hypothetical protein n=1 Tax=Streptomyces sp. NPDC058678 TaxID=3346595 RepID=UPI0036633EAD
MPRTTPPRPLDVTAHFPELAPLARPTVRLHPRPGTPTAADSSIGGPLLWPPREPWPTCPDHGGPAQLGHAPEDVRLRRRILREAWSRPREEGTALLTPEERAIVDRLRQATLIPLDGPLPMLPVAQLHAADLPGPGLPRPDGTDLLQLLWCPFDHEGHMPRAALRWRTAAQVTDPVPAPRTPVLGHDRHLPEPCVLHPETVTEYPAPHELPEELADRIEAWEDEQGLVYQYDLGVAPGCKVGGHAPWSYTDPFPMACPDCGSAVRPLLTIDSGEWDGGSTSWRPVEDADHPGPMFRSPARATELSIGRDHALQLYVCTVSYGHAHLQNIQ